MRSSIIYHTKHLKRYREILRVLSRHGFGYLLETLHINIGLIPFWKTTELTEPATATAERLRQVLEELGPTFIKLGQLLSTRPELLPPAYILQLEQLQDNVASESFDSIRFTVEKELGKPLSWIFEHLNETPLATASIGQVHHGKLLDGTEVAVKVQRTNVAQQIQADLEILSDVAQLLESRFSWARHYRFISLTEEFANTIRDELDYSTEAANADRLRENLRSFHRIKIPEIYWGYSTGKVLTMEYLPGLKINTITKEIPNQQELAQELIEVFFKQIIVDGFFHADLHPGNLHITPDGKIVLMDFGMMGRIDEVSREKLIQLFIKGIQKDSDGVASLLGRFGTAGSIVDKAGLRREVFYLLDKYYSRSLEKIRIGSLLQDMVRISLKYHINIPREFILVSRSVLLLESLLERLDPSLNWVSTAKPLVRKLLKSQLNPFRLIKRSSHYALNFAQTVLELPEITQQVLRKLEEGKLQITLEHQYFERFIHKINLVGNRLSFSLIIAAIIVGTSLVAQKAEDSFLWRLPISELGFVIAVMMGLWLIISIIRSGKL